MSVEPTPPRQGPAQAPARAVQRGPVTRTGRPLAHRVEGPARRVRSRELINSMVLFTLMTVMVFSLALSWTRRPPERGGRRAGEVVSSPGCGFKPQPAFEQDRGSLDALLLAPSIAARSFSASRIGNLLFVLVIAFSLMLLLTVMFKSADQAAADRDVLLAVSASPPSAPLDRQHERACPRARTLREILLLPVSLPVFVSAWGQRGHTERMPSETGCRGSVAGVAMYCSWRGVTACSITLSKSDHLE